METISNAFVCAMGMGTVFVGLICLIIICKIVGFFCNIGKKEQTAAAPAVVAALAVADSIPNKQELIAAVSAAVAEELGTDVSAIRITSFKKL